MVGLLLVLCGGSCAGTPEATVRSGGDSTLLTDARDGHVYRTARIGRQTWMAENLDYAGSGRDTVGICYGHSADSCAKYGRLYAWPEATRRNASDSAASGVVRGVCPEGWHVPSDGEWTLLERSVDETRAASGEMLKSKDGWRSGEASDSYGFHALPGGRCDKDVVGKISFGDIGTYGLWWTATELNGPYVWYRGMSADDPDVYRGDDNKKCSFSLRCVKDEKR